jgi:hypothetical protein
MNRSALMLLVACCGLGCTESAEESAYRFHKPIHRDAAPGEGILAVALDPDLYASTRDGFSDVRILDDTGTGVPYVLEQSSRPRTEQVRETSSSKVVSLREGDDHGLEIVLRLDDKAPEIDGLTIVTPLRDYEHRVRVLGASADRDDWKPLVESALIFDYSRYMDVRNRDIKLPANHARRFKLEISGGLDQLESPFMGLMKETQPGAKERQTEFRELQRRPFRIDRIETWRTIERPSELKPEKTAYQASVVRVEHDAKEKTTKVALRSRREPLTGFTLRTPSRNFNRLARVLVPARDVAGSGWREVGQGTIHRYQLGDFKDEKLAVEFPEQRNDSYLLVIEDGDSPPLGIDSVDAEGNTYRLLFVSAAGPGYRLAYGSDDAQAPHYDTTAVLAALGPKHQAVAVGLGDQVLDRAAPRSRGLRELLNSRAVLMLVLGLMIVVMAWILLRAGKQIAKLPGPEA